MVKYEAQELRKNGTAIVTLTADDVDILFDSLKKSEKVSDMPSTKAQLEQYEKNRRRYLDAHDTTPIDFKLYERDDMDTPEGKRLYRERVMTVTKLVNAGYSKVLIRAFHILIMHDYSAEDIIKMFSNDVQKDYVESIMVAMEE